MAETQILHTDKKKISTALRLGIALFLILSGVYLFVYRGHPLSIDEIGLFDSVESFVNHGTLDRTIEIYRPGEPIANFPYKQPLYEPMQVLLSSPLFWIAQRVPAVGQFHIILLFNFGVMLLTAISLYIIALRLRYPVFVAWLGALLFAVATLSLHYSRLYFREPLMGLFALWVFFLAIRLGERITIKSLMLFLIALLSMILTKQVGVLFLPGILLCLLTNRISFKRVAILTLFIAGIIAVFFVLLFIISPDFGDDRYSVTRWLNPANWQINYVLESFLGYQISPARSFWLYSPVLLLSFLGGGMLIKRGKGWMVAGIVLAFVLTSGAYGALRLGSNWNGGWSWGPRYLVPLIPVCMLLVLPALSHFVKLFQLSSIFALLQRIAFIALIIWSLIIQLLSIAIPFPDFYYNYMVRNPSTPILTAWSPANWDWQHSPIGYHISRLDITNLDIAWYFAPNGGLIVFVALLLIVIGSILLKKATMEKGQIYASLFIAMLFLCSGIVGGLYSLRADPRYVQTRDDIYRLVHELGNEIKYDEVVLINDTDFTVMLIFMNWFKEQVIYTTLPQDETLPAQENEQSANLASGMRTATTLSTLPEITQLAIEWSSKHFESIWLVTQTGVFTPEANRPLERYMAEHFYPAIEVSTGPQARAILYQNVMDRENTLTIQPTIPSSSSDNLEMTLLSIDFMNGTQFVSGDFVPINLAWHVTHPISVDYHISVYLIDEDGSLVTQRDSLPLGTLGFTSRWLPGEIYQDHHALKLPDRLNSGTYSLQIAVYKWLNANEFETVASIKLADIDVHAP